MNILILPEARADLELGCDFYESQNSGVGEYFLNSLMAEIDSLRIYAGIHPKEHRLYRLLAKRFPFAIFYNLNGQTIEVYAVLDCRQDPAKIQQRLKSTRTE